ncbi:MAG: SMI1/KNR4 family protein [Capnocytophaga sp.]|nr:SMI1/KNR4 family protein [Capnocytophaga sp.]
MNIAQKYLKGLAEAYRNNGQADEWQKIITTAHGASETDLTALKDTYPEVPQSLLDLLREIDGTYYREYEKGKVLAYFLGSDVDEGEYPYYLLSATEIVANKGKAKEYYGDYVDREYEEVEMDDRIIDDASQMNWLHFSNCMNNGGTSQLFIDFSPSPKGKVGQIVRYLHDPDEITVIADSFDEYLQQLIDEDYPFIFEDED